MNYTIQFSPEATDDLTEILGWYKEQPVPDLQKKFITAISTTFKTLEKSPKSYALRFKNVRCAVVKKYPISFIIGLMQEIAVLLNLMLASLTRKTHQHLRSQNQ